MTESVNSSLIQRFIDALWLEEGLSQNTQLAYASDLQHFLAWVAHEHGRMAAEVRSTDIEAYLGHKFRRKASSRSMARLVSSLRKFFRYHSLAYY